MIKEQNKTSSDELDLRTQAAQTEQNARALLDIAKESEAIFLSARRAEEGASAYQRAKTCYKQARKILEAKALSSDNDKAETLYQLGRIYYEGLGVPKDIYKAVVYYEQSASLQHASALNTLGFIHQHGEIENKSPDVAKSYYERAASLGNHHALYNLGWMYEHAEDGTRNYLTARDYYEKAMEKGNITSRYALGWLYQYGLGVDKDLELAMNYYECAAALDDTPALLMLGDYYQTIGNREKAEKYYQRAATLNAKEALYKLGKLYDSDYGIDQNYEKAHGYYQEAIKKDHASFEEYYRLGCFYEKGLGVEQSYYKALDYYLKAAELGDIDAYCKLGDFYSKGLGVEIDLTKAKKNYKIAAQNEHAEGNFKLATFYKQGLGTEINPEKAIRHYKEAADLQYIPAMLALGDLYLEGWDAERNIKLVRSYYIEAQELDSIDALYKLGMLNEIEGNAFPKNSDARKEHYDKAAQYYREISSIHLAAKHQLNFIIASGETFNSEEERQETKHYLEKELLEQKISRSCLAYNYETKPYLPANLVPSIETLLQKMKKEEPLNILSKRCITEQSDLDEALRVSELENSITLDCPVFQVGESLLATTLHLLATNEMKLPMLARNLAWGIHPSTPEALISNIKQRSVRVIFYPGDNLKLDEKMQILKSHKISRIFASNDEVQDALDFYTYTHSPASRRLPPRIKIIKDKIIAANLPLSTHLPYEMREEIFLNCMPKHFIRHFSEGFLRQQIRHIINSENSNKRKRKTATPPKSNKKRKTDLSMLRDMLNTQLKGKRKRTEKNEENSKNNRPPQKKKKREDTTNPRPRP